MKDSAVGHHSGALMQNKLNGTLTDKLLQHDFFGSEEKVSKRVGRPKNDGLLRNGVQENTGTQWGGSSPHLSD